MDNRTMTNIGRRGRRYFLVLAALLLVALTSCPIKNGIKNLAGIPANTEQGPGKNTASVQVHTAERCAQIDLTDVQRLDWGANQAYSILPALLFTATFLFLAHFRPRNQGSTHPHYNDSAKIRSAIPLFLEYRKLIVHFAH
ncbi:hypothetical protein [Sphingobacterium suaedae]|uniref:Lipoprotein n=1 Tax=Sphingobacterium suaedae TaxID=1686402 RepID=A0ABW5KMK5_9SPHI